MQGGIVLVREQRKPDVLDVRLLVAGAVDAFCEEFGMAGTADRKLVFEKISSEAREMGREL